MTLSLEKIFAQNMSPYLKQIGCLAVACSGGVDSLALTFVAQAWALERGKKFVAIHVDHGLRHESEQDALKLEKMLLKHAMRLVIKKWIPAHKPQAKVQEQARAARYALLEEACIEEEAEILCCAHHLEDQLETFLMRLLKGSHIQGLCAIPEQRLLGKIIVLRPFLGCSKERLQNFLTYKGIQAIEDPTNAESQYERNRLRQHVLPYIQQVYGLKGFATSLENIAQGVTGLKHFVKAFWEKQIIFHPFGIIEIPKESFLDLPQWVGLEIIRLCLCSFYPQHNFTLDKRVRNIYQRMTTLQCTHFNSGKCYWYGRTHCFLIGKDVAYCTQTVELPSYQKILWDRRFEVEKKTQEPIYSKMIVRALGKDGWAYVRKQEGVKSLMDFPSRLLYAIPSLWKGHQLLSIPFVKDMGAFPSNKYVTIHNVASRDLIL